VATGAGVEHAAVRLAAEAERLSWTDPHLAALQIKELAALIRELRLERPSSITLPASLEEFDGYADEIAIRLAMGRLRGIAGLERRTRQYVAAVAISG
jgi:hypothetical protein